MLSLIRRHKALFLAGTAAALALRLFYLLALPQTGGDAVYYADVAKNLLEHGRVALTGANGPVSTYSRLPGYPLFVAVVFAVFGIDRFHPLLAVQVIIDLATCFLVAELARRMVDERAARTAFLLTALCPFLAQYAAGAYSETLAIFFTSLALLLLVRGLEEASRREAFLGGAALAAGIFVRADTGLLLITICGYVGRLAWRQGQRRRQWVVFGAILAATALAPLVPWTVRNWVVFHRFQPLPPRQAQEPHEHVDGILRWTRTWLVDETSVQTVYWRLGVAPVAIDDLPERATDSADERGRTEALLGVANGTHLITPALDAEFGALAAERIRRSPFRYYVQVPALRLLSIWLRPRVDMLPIDPYWWRLPKTPRDTVVTAVLGFLNLFLLGAAAAALLARRRIRFRGALIAFIGVRSLFLLTVLPEARYTLECFPALIVLAAAGLSRDTQGHEVT